MTIKNKTRINKIYLIIIVNEMKSYKLEYYFYRAYACIIYLLKIYILVVDIED